MRLIDADKLKQHYAWWNDENKELFDTIVDAQPTVEKRETPERRSITVNELFDHFSCNFDAVAYYDETANVGGTARRRKQKMSKERKNNPVILAPPSYVAVHRKQPNVARQDMRKEDEGKCQK